FGVGVPSSAKAILHSVNSVVNGYHNDGSLAMLTVDFSNAFNLVDRSTLLHEYIRSETIARFFFMLGILMMGPLLEMRVLDIIRVSGPCLGLELHIKKTKIFWPSCNGTKLREGLFPVDIRRPSLGVKFLGGVVSRDADFISGFATRKTTNAVYLTGLLPQLHDPQSELLLLRSYMGIAKLFFRIKDLSACTHGGGGLVLLQRIAWVDREHGGL
ncbi:hypothetical protein Tco_1441030, partial [Tanacetum coccineum]